MNGDEHKKKESDRLEHRTRSKMQVLMKSMYPVCEEPRERGLLEEKNLTSKGGLKEIAKGPYSSKRFKTVVHQEVDGGVTTGEGHRGTTRQVFKKSRRKEMGFSNLFGESALKGETEEVPREISVVQAA